MATLNKTLIIGNLGCDPKTKQVGDRSVTEFSVAVNRRFAAQGEARQETTWFQVEAWGRVGEVCAQYLTKGRPVFVEGRIKIDAWDNDKGHNERVVIVASDVQFLSDRAGEASAAEENDETTF